MNYHFQSVEQVAEALKTSPSGLSSDEAKRRLQQHGKNVLEAKKKKTIFSILLNQLTDFMILVLIAAAVISGFLSDVTDAIDKAMEALEGMAASHARVQRDNQTIDIEASDLVPGDVIVLDVGNIIPADVRFIETHTLKVDDSSLTG